jgi:hypothetical protein
VAGLLGLLPGAQEQEEVEAQEEAVQGIDLGRCALHPVGPVEGQQQAAHHDAADAGVGEAAQGGGVAVLDLDLHPREKHLQRTPPPIDATRREQQRHHVEHQGRAAQRDAAEKATQQREQRIARRVRHPKGIADRRQLAAVRVRDRRRQGGGIDPRCDQGHEQGELAVEELCGFFHVVNIAA